MKVCRFRKSNKKDLKILNEIRNIDLQTNWWAMNYFDNPYKRQGLLFTGSRNRCLKVFEIDKDNGLENLIINKEDVDKMGITAMNFSEKYLMLFIGTLSRSLEIMHMDIDRKRLEKFKYYENLHEHGISEIICIDKYDVLITGSYDGTVKIFKVNLQVGFIQLISHIRENNIARIMNVQYQEKNNILITGSYTRIVNIYTLETKFFRQELKEQILMDNGSKKIIYICFDVHYYVLFVATESGFVYIYEYDPQSMK